MKAEDIKVCKTSQAQREKCHVKLFIQSKNSNSRKQGVEWWLPGKRGKKKRNWSDVG
jgi:hypothetical protein